MLSHSVVPQDGEVAVLQDLHLGRPRQVLCNCLKKLCASLSTVAIQWHVRQAEHWAYCPAHCQRCIDRDRVWLTEQPRDERIKRCRKVRVGIVHQCGEEARDEI